MIIYNYNRVNELLNLGILTATYHNDIYKFLKKKNDIIKNTCAMGCKAVSLG